MSREARQNITAACSVFTNKTYYSSDYADIQHDGMDARKRRPHRFRDACHLLFRAPISGCPNKWKQDHERGR